jgi:hypothetical protein
MADHHQGEHHEPREVGISIDPLEAPALGVSSCSMPWIATPLASPKMTTNANVARA